ncbi:unnamed protein product [Didymodactylos carnosus]|uniref:TRPM SLOG domain-containing protein n=1 Tax=Didymodactylos carnosus TaxID=1234261 RepID=A0A8S2H831_9BILA|nr:unnamed protein product [Didymodactylos carnosus]CAF3613080.1 unnamed protein product [Didymodactylos carnosus]
MILRSIVPRKLSWALYDSQTMKEGWKLPPPELIISVTGGARFFKLATPRTRNAFQKGFISAAVRTEKTDRVKLYRDRKRNSEEEEGCSLDPNHTHFILLDDGYGQHKRVTCENWKKQQAHKVTDKDQDVPIVQILAEGGSSSIMTICESPNCGTPVIIIDSGNDEFCILNSEQIQSWIITVNEDFDVNSNDRDMFNETLYTPCF